VSRHRKLARVLIGSATVLVLLVAGLFAFFPLLVGSSLAPLTLPEPSTAAGTSASSIDGALQSSHTPG
jgi:hypothetical protein